MSTHLQRGSKQAFFALSALILSLNILQVCYAAPIETESSTRVTVTREVSNFDRVVCGGIEELIVTVGQPYSMKLTGYQEDIDDLETKVNQGKLSIYRKADSHSYSSGDSTSVSCVNGRCVSGENVQCSNNICMVCNQGNCQLVDLSKETGTTATKRRNHPVTIELALPSLIDLSISGASKAIARGLHGESFDLTASGSSNVKASGQVKFLEITASGSSSVDLQALHGESLDLTASGSSNVKVSGQVKSLEVSASGASAVDTLTLSANRVDAHSSGAGSLKVNALEELHAQASGAGNIAYTGNPRLYKSTSGAGSIRKYW